jgi:hypothetical protein
MTLNCCPDASDFIVAGSKYAHVKVARGQPLADVGHVLQGLCHNATHGPGHDRTKQQQCGQP